MALAIVYISKKHSMASARIFMSGNSRAVRLRKDFLVKSTEVEIFRRGDENRIARESRRNGPRTGFASQRSAKTLIHSAAKVSDERPL